MLCASEKSMPSRLMNLIQVEVFSHFEYYLHKKITETFSPIYTKIYFPKYIVLYRGGTENVAEDGILSKYYKPCGPKY